MLPARPKHHPPCVPPQLTSALAVSRLTYPACQLALFAIELRRVTKSYSARAPEAGELRRTPHEVYPCEVPANLTGVAHRAAAPPPAPASLLLSRSHLVQSIITIEQLAGQSIAPATRYPSSAVGRQRQLHTRAATRLGWSTWTISCLAVS